MKISKKNSIFIERICLVAFLLKQRRKKQLWLEINLRQKTVSVFISFAFIR